MLLDSSMDLKIIGNQPIGPYVSVLVDALTLHYVICTDFGLSNEEYVETENGRIHCNTQCGSPAYAAPELLGGEEYGKEADIWSM